MLGPFLPSCAYPLIKRNPMELLNSSFQTAPKSLKKTFPKRNVNDAQLSRTGSIRT
jgi:hypothetical protein